jgi:sirohydrochlorin cobaltochelatase
MTIFEATSGIEVPAGLLLVGHGTRSEQGAAEFFATAELVARALPEVAVEPCFLELAEPTIAEGIERLVARRAPRIVVMPLLLFAAGHANRDIPEAVKAAAADHPALEVRQANHLGCHEAVLKLSAQRFWEAIDSRGDEIQRDTASLDDTALLMVGRGSLEPSATAEMHEFVELRRQMTPVAHAATCFLAMAKPTLDEALTEIAGQTVERIVVQPHLLFQGDLLDGLRSRINEAGRQWPDHQWVVADQLGPHSLLAEAVAARFATECRPDL